MATRLKTVCFPIPNLSSIPDSTVTNFSQITVDLPESSKSFKKVWIEAMAKDIITATGGTIGEWRLGVSVNSATYTTVTQTNGITHSGENMAPFISADFTSHFTTNFTGTSHTFDLRIYFLQNTGTTLGFVGGTALLWVTYEYDDTSTTQVLNAWIPMSSLTANLATSKGTAQDTIPNLDSFLGYGSISYKHMVMVLEGNESGNSVTTTFVVSVQVDNTTQQDSDNVVLALGSDRFVKKHFNFMSGGSPIFTTNATHDFYAWVTPGTSSRFNHVSFTLLVTFTFDSTSANSGNISLLLPQGIDSPMGATTSADYQRGSTEVWIEEPATITTQKSAFRWYFDHVSSITYPYFRCGSQSFNQVYNNAATLCGGNCYQRTIDDNITLARGRNILTADCYNSDTTDKGWNLSGLWILNYKAGKPTQGWGAANHTVLWPVLLDSTSATTRDTTISATSIGIPESNYFINNIGINLNIITSGTVTLYSSSVFIERLSAESGIKWENILTSPTHTDPEVGLRPTYGDFLKYIKRWPNDQDTNRFSIETDRRWRFVSGQGTLTYLYFSVMATYHSITKSLSGSISNSNGGTVNIYLHRADNNTYQAGEKLLQTSRTGDGAFSFDWFDDTENVYISAYEDSTHLGRSTNGVAT